MRGSGSFADPERSPRQADRQSRSRSRDRRRFAAVAALVLVLGFAIRAWTASNLTLLPTSDSGDYLQIADDLRRGYWASPALGERRLPGFPILLAGIRSAFGTSATALLVVQAVLGLLAALAVTRAVHLLAGARVAAVAGVLSATHPVLLLFEHQPMTETFFVATLSVCLWLAVRSSLHGFQWAHGAALGLTAGACVLTRANGVAALAVLGTGLVVLAAVSAGRGGLADRERRRRPLRFALGGIAGFAALLLPWLAYMETRFGELSLVRHRERSRLIFVALHGALDTSLPGFAPYRNRFDPGKPGTIYDVYWQISRLGARGESVARDLVREQVAVHPDRITRARWATARAFVGSGYGREGFSDAGYWFAGILPTHESLATALARFDPFFARFFPGSPRIEERHGSPIWSAAGWAYLSRVRFFLVLGSLVLAALALWRGRGIPGSGMRRWFLVMLFASYVATLGLHVGMLAALDRFAVTFDPVAIVLLALAAAELAGLEPPPGQELKS